MDSLLDLIDGPNELPVAEVLTEIEPALVQETAIDSDGYIYDVNTGEVIGRADIDDRFEVKTDDAADWALELRSKMEGEVVAIDARLRAVTKMLQLQRAEKVRRLAWWDYRFSPSLKAYARSKLKGKSKTAVFGWGKVQFRTTPGSTSVINMELAVAWMRTWLPAKIKTVESVGVKDVLASLAIAQEATGEKPHVGDWLVSSGPGESVTVTTGIDVQLKGVGS